MNKQERRLSRTLLIWLMCIMTFLAFGGYAFAQGERPGTVFINAIYEKSRCGNSEDRSEECDRITFGPLPKRFPTFILLCALGGAAIGGLVLSLVVWLHPR